LPRQCNGVTVTMAFGQTVDGDDRSWGVAPGYGEIWPLAKQFSNKRGVAPGYGEIWPFAKIVVPLIP
ncbi:MAG: hypothetical protein WBF93_21835, partial [Pirellulales bacterium]